MNVICPNCRSTESKDIKSHYDSDDNIDRIECWHLECKSCGRNFSHWKCNTDKLKQIFKSNWEQYK